MPIVSTPEDYAIIDRISYENSDHLETFVNEIEERVLPKIKQKKSFLDIGAGPALMTYRLSRHFKKVAIVEPNLEFVKEYPADIFEVYPVNFEECDLPHPFDFVLCSHMLYHIELDLLPNFIHKMYTSVSVGGKALVNLIAPRGPFHEQASRLNPNYLNSSQVLNSLKSLDIPCQVKKVNITLKARSLHDMLTVCRFFFLEDCFTPETFNNLSIYRLKQIEAEISQFVKECRVGPSRYELPFDEDHILI